MSLVGPGIGAAIDGLAELHSIGLVKEMQLLPWLGEVMTSETMVELIPLWRSLIDHAAEFAEWFEWNDKSRVMARVHEILSGGHL